MEHVTTDIPETWEQLLRERNPWWTNGRVQDVPPFKRWAFSPLLNRFLHGVTPGVLFRGPRQVGKTTLVLQVIEEMLDTGISPERICHIQLDQLGRLRAKDDPILELCRWYAQNIFRRPFHLGMDPDTAPFFLFDEIQDVPNWSPQVKYLLDTFRGTRAVITGSSAFRIQRGQETLAGRVMTMEMGPLFLREIASLRNIADLSPYLPFNGLHQLKESDFWRELRSWGERYSRIRHEAFSAFSERGAYPVPHIARKASWEEMKVYLTDTVIRRTIVHDARVHRRNPQVLEAIFRVICRYAGQSPAHKVYAEEVERATGEPGDFRRMNNAIQFLDDSLLARSVEPLELRLKKQVGGDKLCLADHTLREAWLGEAVPLTPEALEESPHLTDLAGRLAESIVGYFFSSILFLDVGHFPARPTEPEVDFVLTIGDQRIPVEVKYRRKVDESDLAGLRRFMDRAFYRAPFGLLITLTDENPTDDPRIVALPLSTLLLMR